MLISVVLIFFPENVVIDVIDRSLETWCFFATTFVSGALTPAHRSQCMPWAECAWEWKLWNRSGGCPVLALCFFRVALLAWTILWLCWISHSWWLRLRFARLDEVSRFESFDFSPPRLGLLLSLKSYMRLGLFPPATDLNSEAFPGRQRKGGSETNKGLRAKWCGSIHKLCERTYVLCKHALCQVLFW